MELKVITKLIQNAESDFQEFCANADEGFSYYNNKGKIKKTGAAAIDEVNSYLKKVNKSPLSTADNRIGLNLHKVVTDEKIGYLLSEPVTIDSENKQALESVNNVLGEQFSEVLKQLGTDATNTGRGWLTYWYEDNKFDYYYLNPKTVMPIYDYSKPKKELKIVIRAYQYADSQGDNVTRYEVWDDKEVAYVIKKTVDNTTTYNFDDLGELSNPMPHNYGRPPFICFKNNAKETFDLQMYKDIIDALEKVVSGFCNDVDDIQEIIWVIKNYAGETETEIEVETEDGTTTAVQQIDLLKKLKATKWINVDENGGVDKITGEIPFEARKTLIELLDSAFWKAAMAVNPEPDKVGNQSGEYMEFLYGQLEEKASLMETTFRTALNDFLQAVCKYLNVNAEFTQKWNRTKPRNIRETVDIINNTPGEIMSDETKTKLHPYIEDAEAERKLIDEETKKKQNEMLELEGLYEQAL